MLNILIIILLLIIIVIITTAIGAKGNFGRLWICLWP